MALVPVIKDNDWVSVRQAIAALSTLRLGKDAHPVYGGLTLTGLDGVLKASSGVVFGSATLDDLGEGTTYKRLTFAQAVDLTDGGETTLHTHPSSGITEVDWGDIGGTLSDQIDLQEALDDKAPVNDILADIVFGNLTLNNTGLRLMDTNASHYLTIRCSSDLTSNKLLTFVTGDYNTNIAISGSGPASNNITLGDWFNQSVKVAATPTFTGLVLKGGITVDVDKTYNIGSQSKRINSIYANDGDFYGDLYTNNTIYIHRDIDMDGGVDADIYLRNGTTTWLNIYPDISGNIFVDVPVGDLYFTAGGGDIRFDNENLITSGAITGGAITGTTLFATAADGLTLGTDAATNIAGKIKFWSAGAVNWSTTLTAGVQTADANYTLPLARPTANSQALLGTNADPSVLSWGTDFGANNVTTTGLATVGTLLITDATIDLKFMKAAWVTSRTCITPQSAGAVYLHLNSYTGNETEDVFFSILGYGTTASIARWSQWTIGWNSSLVSWQMTSSAGGTGAVVRPIRIACSAYSYIDLKADGVVYVYNHLSISGDISSCSNVYITGWFHIDGVKVVGNRVIDSRCADAINSGDATTDGVIDALRDAMISHGLIAAA